MLKTLQVFRELSFFVIATTNLLWTFYKPYSQWRLRHNWSVLTMASQIWFWQSSQIFSEKCILFLFSKWMELTRWQTSFLSQPQFFTAIYHNFPSLILIWLNRRQDNWFTWCKGRTGWLIYALNMRRSFARAAAKLLPSHNLAAPGYQNLTASNGPSSDL